MATVEKRGDGWRVRWRDPDGKARCRQCPTARSARELKIEVEETIARGRRWTPSAAVRLPFLKDLIDAYVSDLLRVRAPSTRDRAFYALDPFYEWVRVRAKTSHPTVDLLTRSLLEAFDAHQVAIGNGYATRRTSMWAIGSAWRWGWHHPEWKAALAEPSIPRMPRAQPSRPMASTWAQLDAVVHLAEIEARRLPSRTWLFRVALLMRGLGWRVTQCLGLDATDYDPQAGTLRLRGELGKTGAEKVGRLVPVAPWLRTHLDEWTKTPGRLVGSVAGKTRAADLVRELWRSSGAPEGLYRQRPDHAFRIGLITGLAELRADREAVEHYVGHVITGVRAHYVDPSRLPLGEIAKLIPPVGPRVRPVSALAEVAKLDAGNQSGKH